jgi:hypothetical protein
LCTGLINEIVKTGIIGQLLELDDDLCTVIAVIEIEEIKTGAKWESIVAIRAAECRKYWSVRFILHASYPVWQQQYTKFHTELKCLVKC